MPLIRNRYLLTASALLLGVTLLWYGQSSEPLVDEAISDAESKARATEVVDEALADADVASSSPASDSNSGTALLDINKQPDAVTDNIEVVEPAGTATATNNRNASTVTESPQPEPATLSPRVYNIINEVQLRQQAGQWEEALNEMNALYAELDQLTPFEQATLLNFYTNTLTRLEMWQEAITAFNLILQVPELRPDLSARALLALGQLHAREGERVEGIAYLKEWLDYTNGMDNMDALTPRVNDMITCLSNTDGMNCTF